ncbi:MAG: N-acetylmuramoyl-L-alanine amidase [Rickettsiaceae bacterium]|nr:MAG: N-acetylmuramoyl-L-alanine amidase [Rickettsiaceae bacterium]
MMQHTINTQVGLKSGISATNNSKFSEARKLDTEVSCVVITYSVCQGSLEQTINTLHKNGTSVHYIIDQNGKQYQSVDDYTQKAYYAGLSSWKGQENVNEFAIGVMLINDGESKFTSEQKTAVTSLLKDIASRHPDINIKNDVIGLGEVAARHIAPGKHFFWQELAEDGIGQFFKTTEEQRQTPSTKTIIQTQEELKFHGYGIEINGNLDEPTSNWYAKFNTRYVPEQEPSNTWTTASQHVFDVLHPEYQETVLSGDTSLSHSADA